MKSGRAEHWSASSDWGLCLARFIKTFCQTYPHVHVQLIEESPREIENVYWLENWIWLFYLCLSSMNH